MDVVQLGCDGDDGLNGCFVVGGIGGGGGWSAVVEFGCQRVGSAEHMCGMEGFWV